MKILQLAELVTVVAAVGLMGCASKTEKLTVSCGQRDWFEIGRRDGAQGAPLERLHGYKMECGNEFDPGLETLYRNGRNAGLVEYCTPENGFETGRMGLNYSEVCPVTMEKDFLKHFQRGQETRSLEIKIKDLDEQIEMISEQILNQEGEARRSAGDPDMTAPGRPTDGKNNLARRLDQLKKARAENARDLNKLIRITK